MSNRRRPRTEKPDQQLRPGEHLTGRQQPAAGSINGYRCETCGGSYLTVDVDQGVTPMFGPCFATEGCDGRAVSMGYPPGPPPASLGVPIIEWYRPRSLLGLGPALADHVARGGLARRAAAGAPTWVKAIA